jgi:hypothetical protein
MAPMSIAQIAIIPSTSHTSAALNAESPESLQVLKISTPRSALMRTAGAATRDRLGLSIVSIISALTCALPPR